MPSQGDIVLIPIPFTDLSSQKSPPGYRDLERRVQPHRARCCGGRNDLQSDSQPLQFCDRRERLAQGTLNRPGTVRADKIYTLEKSLIVKTFGHVNDHTLDRIRAALAGLMAAKP